MAQSVKHWTLDFGSGNDLGVCELEPGVRLCAGSMEPAWDSLSSSLSAPLPLVLSLKINTLKERKKASCKSKKKTTGEPDLALGLPIFDYWSRGLI